MNKKILIGILALFFTLPASFADVTFEDGVTSSISRGIICFVKGDLDQAIQEFSNAIKEEPNSALAYYHRAKAQENKNNINQAISDYSTALKLDARYIFAYYYRAVLYQKKGNFDLAIADYTTIIESELSSNELKANAYNNRALAYDKKGNFAHAIFDYNKSLELLPKQFNAYYNRGLTYLNMGAYPLVLEDFNAELEMQPNAVLIRRYSMAVLFFLKKQYQPCWYEVFLLQRAGEILSPTFIRDLKKASGIDGGIKYKQPEDKNKQYEVLIGGVKK